MNRWRVALLTAIVLLPISEWSVGVGACPDQFSEFLTRFETDAQFQLASVRFPLQIAYIDNTAEPEPKRKWKRIGRDAFINSQYPFYPTHEMQSKRKLVRTIKEVSASTRVVTFNQPESDAYSIEYHFTRDSGCWRLTFMDDRTL